MDERTEMRGPEGSAQARDLAQAQALDRGEAATLLWNWREYRNAVMWTSVYRYGAAAVLIALAPYVLPGIIGELGLTVLVFPAAAGLLSFGAAYMIAVQYRLYKQVDREFRRSLGEYAPPELGQGRVRDRVLTVSIGRTLTFAFLFFSIPVQIASAVLLARLAQG